MTPATAPQSTGFPVRRSRLRFIVMLAAGLVSGVAAGLGGRWVEAPAVGWSVAAFIYVAWVWIVIGRLDAAGTRAHAVITPRPSAWIELALPTTSIAAIIAARASGRSGVEAFQSRYRRDVMR